MSIGWYLTPVLVLEKSFFCCCQKRLMNKVTLSDCPNIVTMSLLSSGSTSMLAFDFWIFVCISFGCLSRLAQFNPCICSVRLILSGGVWEIGEDCLIPTYFYIFPTKMLLTSVHSVICKIGLPKFLSTFLVFVSSFNKSSLHFLYSAFLGASSFQMPIPLVARAEPQPKTVQLSPTISTINILDFETAENFTNITCIIRRP